MTQFGGSAFLCTKKKKKSDYETLFCPHVVCPFFFLFEFEESHLGDEPTASLWLCSAARCPQRVSMWECGHAAGRMSVCEARCLVGGDGVCFHVRVWEGWSLLQTAFLTRLEGINPFFFLFFKGWGACEVTTLFELKMSIFVKVLNWLTILMALMTFL